MVNSIGSFWGLGLAECDSHFLSIEDDVKFLPFLFTFTQGSVSLSIANPNEFGPDYLSIHLYSRIESMLKTTLAQDMGYQATYVPGLAEPFAWLELKLKAMAT